MELYFYRIRKMKKYFFIRTFPPKTVPLVIRGSA
jgi:hypothetical protein